MSYRRRFGGSHRALLSGVVAGLLLIGGASAANAQAAAVCDPAKSDEAPKAKGEKLRDYPAMSTEAFGQTALRALLDLNLAIHNFNPSNYGVSGRRLSGIGRNNQMHYWSPKTQPRSIYRGRSLVVFFSGYDNDDEFLVRGSGNYAHHSLTDPCFFDQLFAVFDAARERYERSPALDLSAARTDRSLEEYDAEARQRLEDTLAAIEARKAAQAEAQAEARGKGLRDE